MPVWLVQNVYGEPLGIFSGRDAALRYISDCFKASNIVGRHTPSRDIIRFQVDSGLSGMEA